MVEKDNKFYYNWEDFDLCISDIIIKNPENNIHIVVPYRGGLPFGTSLSNKMNKPLSIIEFQRYDGNTKEAIFLKNTIKDSDIILLVDDIADEGSTIKECLKLLDNYPQEIRVHTMIGSNKHPKKWKYTFEHKGWSVFPYE